MRPKRNIILRGVINSTKVKPSCSSAPKTVWTLLNEADFKATGELVHVRNAFLEERMHDWDWRDGVLNFYGHSGLPGDKHDLILVYEEHL